MTGYEKMTVSAGFRTAQDGSRRGRQVPGGQEQHGARRRRKALPAEQLLKDLKGMTSLAYTTGDPVALAKALTAYAKDQSGVHLQGGHGRRPRDRRQERSTIWPRMPSKEEIFAKLLFLINAPAQRLVTAMNGVGRNLAVVVDQGVKENKFQ